MKVFVIFFVLASVAMLMPHVHGLLIDPFTTHNELKQVVTSGDSFVFTMEGKDLERPLGLRLQYSDDDDVLKVKIRDPNGNVVLTSLVYNIDEYQNSISAEFTPQYAGLYQVEVINMGQSSVSLDGYFGEMLTWKEINDIENEHGYARESYDSLPVVLVFVLFGGSVGFVVGYIVFRWIRK